jgi:hemerythrin-like domain-containing protein
MIQIGATPATIETPLEHLQACHRRIEQRLDTLVRAAGALDSDKKAALGAIASSLEFLDTNGVLHTADEEQSLFPRLRPLLSSSELEFVNSLEAQHTEAESILAALKREVRALSEGQSSVAYEQYARQLRGLYQEHIRTEDSVLTPLAQRSLDDDALAAIADEMRARRNLTSPASGTRATAKHAR